MEFLLDESFIALSLIVLFAIRLSSQRFTRDKGLRGFWLTVISCFLLLAEEQLEIAASLDPSLIFWRTLLSILGYVLRSTAALGLALVVSPPEPRSRWLFLPCTVNLLACSTAFFTDIVFGFDADYSFYRGPLGYLPFIIPTLYMLYILWISFRHYDGGQSLADRLILLAGSAFCLLSALLDALRGGARLHEALMICSVFFYIFLRSYDIRRDSLTRLLNRQSLYDDCESMRQRITAAASLDMNGLKELNDSQGHQAGDVALKAIGDCLQQVSGPRVLAYRIGGDEFILLFFRSDETVVRATLEEVRSGIAETEYTVAYGYSMREPGDLPEAIIRRSDLKMFEHKAQYYREKQHDRRRQNSGASEHFTGERKKSLEASPDPVTVFRFVDYSVQTLAVSDGFCRLFGIPDRRQAVSLLDRSFYWSIHPDDLDRFTGAFLRFSEGTEEMDVIYRSQTSLTDSQTGYHVIHARGAHGHAETGARIAYVWYMDEGVYTVDDTGLGAPISQALNRALHEESILHAAHYDDLTGLPNLSWFFKLCETALADMHREGTHGALVYMDLYGMKYFNHTYSFAEGDVLLKAFAELLVRLFGKDCCCRIAADHFIVRTTDEQAEALLTRLFAEARHLNGGKTLPVYAGLYSFAMEEVPVSSAYDRAKMACDAIRKSDVSAWNPYSQELRDAIRKQQYLVANIDRAISERWIQVYYQPIVRAVSEKICEEEALARCIDPVEGFLSPAEFIPLLEKAGLIYKLDLCVLDQVLEKMQAEKAAGTPPVPHSFNLSRSDFEACDIVEEIRRRVDAAGIGRNQISIEITESIIGSDLDFMKEQVARFHELGFPVWMDDFGSGYSALDVLHSIPFDVLKFDMSFMRKLEEGENGRIILTELMKMATALGVDTICEGVETDAHVRFLQEIGCSKLQGYYFGRPAPESKLLERTIDGRHFDFENPEASAYYETVGRMDLYDLAVISGLDENPFQHTYSTLPTAILEIRGELLRFVRTTPSYRSFMKRFFGIDISGMAHAFGKADTPFMDNLLKTCCARGGSTFFDETMPDGSMVRSFARLIGVNPVNGHQAVAVAVLAVTDPGDSQSFASIAQAMSADGPPAAGGASS